MHGPAFGDNGRSSRFVCGVQSVAMGEGRSYLATSRRIWWDSGLY